MTELRIIQTSPEAVAPPDGPEGRSPVPTLRRLAILCLIVGVLVIGICILWAAVTSSPHQFFRSYLLAFACCANIPLGCLGLLMMSHLTGGAWGLIPRRIYEAAARSLPWLFVLFIPVLCGLPWLYAFMRPEQVALSETLQQERGYLNTPFYVVRSLVYFALWILLASLLASWSRRQDESSPEEAERLARRMRVLSGPGLFFFCLAVSFAATDWLMILLPEFYSTVFGMLVLVGQGLTAYAFVIVVLGGLSRCAPFARAVSPKLWHDLGKLLQAFVLLWAYMAFSQLVVSWSGNLPREIRWYIPRLRTSWFYLGVVLLLGHFALPFFLLLFRALKRRAATLVALAIFLLFMRLCDQLWLVEPNFHPGGFYLHGLDVLLPIGLLCLWIAAFAYLLSHRLGLPLAAPGLADALAHRQPAPGGTLP
jgi:hypothetical protein